MPVLTPEQDRVRNRDVDGPGESSPSSGLVANSQTQGDGNGGFRSDSLIEKELELVREKERLICLELELEHLRSGNRTRTSGGGMEFNLRDEILSFSRFMKGVLTSMPSSETLVLSWFDGVEHVFETYEVPERLRGYLVRPYFTESMRALVNRLNVGERSGYGAVKERVLLELGLSRAEVWRPLIETTTSLKDKHENPRQAVIPENCRVKCLKCKKLGHLSCECPRKKTPDEELLFHKKRVDAESFTVEKDSSREPDKVTTDVGKTDGNNLDHQSQKRPQPSVLEVPQILLQADDTERSSKNNHSCLSVQADVEDRNELNVSRAWRTSQRAEDNHDEQVNVGDETPYTLPERQVSRRSEDDPCVNLDNVEAGPDTLPGLHKFWQANDDHVKNMDVGYKEELRVSSGRRTFRQAEDDDGEDVDDDEVPNLSPGRQVFGRAEDDHDENVNVDDEKERNILLWWQTFWQADNDHGKDVGVDKKSDILLGWLTSQRAGEDVRESGDSEEDAVFEMKSSQNIARDADQGSITCQPATCERAGSAEDVDNGDRLRGPFLIRKPGKSINCRRSCAGKFRNQLYTVRFKARRNLDGLNNLTAKRPRLGG
uniref:CCHC-type domain-containing protein n=1 Tax=Ixodes ricinus TaxID=34613 RepID=A0A6B0VDY7_IXORI